MKTWHPEKSVISKEAKIGKQCTIHAPVWIGPGVFIDDGCKIQAFAFLPTGVRLGKGVFIGPHVCFTNDKNPPSGGKHWQGTIVEDGAVIGANATILPGLRIGARSVIGAGAVLTHSTGADEVWVGNPAKKVVQATVERGAPFDDESHIRAYNQLHGDE